ncbi:hypothetical protein NAI73_11150, partial [Francisella tularensis subsp. holarctica]|uniref:hypothetical protein n=1 Tax=Francisella tularensis TaxID=263 RepID=UPI002381CB69
ISSAPVAASVKILPNGLTWLIVAALVRRSQGSPSKYTAAEINLTASIPDALPTAQMKSIGCAWIYGTTVIHVLYSGCGATP